LFKRDYWEHGMEKIGLIAGNGNFPVLFAKEASKNGFDVVAIAIKEETPPELEDFVKSLYWVKFGQLNKMIQWLKSESVKKAVMVGHIKHKHIFKQHSLDLKALNLLIGLKDKKADTILGSIADALNSEGIEILPSTTFLSFLMPLKGVITKRGPTSEEENDIAFGTSIAKEIARLDIGQTVVVKNASVVAVEAMEGTDETIKRAGKIGGRGIVVVKVSKPKQDLRFDVPVIGIGTIHIMVETGASALAVDAQRCLFFDKEEALKLADENNICILAQ